MKHKGSLDRRSVYHYCRWIHQTSSTNNSNIRQILMFYRTSYKLSRNFALLWDEQMTVWLWRMQVRVI